MQDQSDTDTWSNSGCSDESARAPSSANKRTYIPPPFSFVRGHRQQSLQQQQDTLPMASIEEIPCEPEARDLQRVPLTPLIAAMIHYVSIAESSKQASCLSVCRLLIEAGGEEQRQLAMDFVTSCCCASAFVSDPPALMLQAGFLSLAGSQSQPHCNILETNSQSNQHAKVGGGGGAESSGAAFVERKHAHKSTESCSERVVTAVRNASKVLEEACHDSMTYEVSSLNKSTGLSNPMEARATSPVAAKQAAKCVAPHQRVQAVAIKVSWNGMVLTGEAVGTYAT